MRYLFGFLCVCALGVVPLVGCSETTGDGGGGGSAGTGGMGGSGGSAGSGGSGGFAGSGGIVSSACDGDLCEGVDCDDADPCTRDVCNVADGTCSYVAACDDFSDCTTQMCDPADDSCSTPTAVADGTACAGGTCQGGVCELAGSVLPCTEQGIRNAIAAGDGTYTFACDGTTPVVTRAEIEIDNDVILNGEGNLTVDGNCAHHVFSVPVGVTTELQGFTVTNGVDDPHISGAGGIRIDTDATVTLTDTTVSGNTGGWAGGITNNRGTLTLNSSTVSDNTGSGIVSTGPLTLTDSTVSGNVSSNGASGGGIVAYGITLLVNSTISGNSSSGGLGGGINTCDPLAGCNPLTLISCTIAGNVGEPSILTGDASMSVTNSLVDGDCDGDITSNGYNIESPGDTCGFDHGTDLVNVTEGELNLGELADNGGSTETHALFPGGVAIDQIPAVDCIDSDGEPLTTDQRDFPRDSMCDVGAFELQP